MIEIEVQNETHQTQTRLKFAAVPRMGEGIRLQEPDGFWVSLIPETLERTTLGKSGPDAPRVNLEFDVIARYVERLLRFQEKGKSHE